ncbi:MAG: acyl-phosphate glycerol 3-phosphate acyltransferase [Omnitrophica bacterium RIFCSPHIGHO2_02_FULL_51_18]|nr:MAG: acyl-phosphate glycerol 3-phosphate acyltransferase [Omnitrophica bacterium RIFCSPHIGHO2_02_FULL_51_18]
MIPFVFSFLTAFLAGAFPTAYLFVRGLKGADIREHGSGNVGATNAARVLGKKIGILIFAIDFLKGLLPALVLARFTAPVFNLSYPELVEFIGFASILGHIFTPFLGGKGGKGIATGAGAICAGYPPIFALMAMVWFLALFLSRKTISVSSLTAAGSFILFSVMLKCPSTIVSYSILLFLLALWTHRSNIYRLFQGNEINPN